MRFIQGKTRNFVVAWAVLAGGLLGGCVTVPTAEGVLQGAWVVVSGEHEGRPMDVVVGGVLRVTGKAFHIRTASGNELQGRLQVTVDKRPAELDFLHANGMRWLAIYEVEDGMLRINYVDVALKEPRPARFTTSGQTEASLLTLRRTVAGS